MVARTSLNVTSYVQSVLLYFINMFMLTPNLIPTNVGSVLNTDHHLGFFSYTFQK